MVTSIRSLSSRISEFRSVVDAAKRQISGIPWYPYDSFQTVRAWHGFTDDHDVDALIHPNPVLDIGCGNGLLAFFLEWAFDCEVHAIDNPLTNFNGMRGVIALKQALDSRITIIEADVDEALPVTQKYSLALMLGLLYHLKNPIGVMNGVARHARHCVMSTRIAQQTSAGDVHFRDAPLVYLGDYRETNSDDTNYWFFSQTALQRLVRRTGWEIKDSFRTGCLVNSDPVRQDRDERMHCLLRSCLPDAWYTVSRSGGFHAQEGDWCWTARIFRFVVKDVVGGPKALQFDFFVSPLTISRFGSVRLALTLNGGAMPQCEYRTHGSHRYDVKIPPQFEIGSTVLLDFELNVALQPEGDQRELGVIVSALSSDCNVRLIV